MPPVILGLLIAASASAQQVCTFTLNPSSRAVPASPDTVGSFAVQASASTCQRTAVSDSPDWLTVSFGSPGTGNGTIGYRVETNNTPQARSGGIVVGNARFSVTQAGAECSFELSPLSARVTNAAGTGSLRVATSCRWTAVSSVPWLRVGAADTGIGAGTIDYAYDANPATTARTGTITVGTRTFTLTQDGAPCTTRLSPTSADHPGSGGAGAITVASSCSWRASPSQPWVTITGSDAGTGNGAVGYRVAENTAPQPRTATITIGDQTFAVRQAASDLPRITGIANAASFAANAAAPGTIVAIFGAQMGPSALVPLQLTADQQFLAKELSGTRVYFDGTPAPLIFAEQSVISAIVPYDAAGKRTVPVVVEYQNRRSAAFNLPIAATAPGIFTQDSSGKGPGAILNSDLTLNTPANPAQRGGFIVIYATGEGVTEPAGVDGKITGADLPQPVAPVFVSIGGAVAEVLYKGAVPGVVAGMIQINARVPPAAPSGAAVPITVTMGNVTSPAGVTVAVQ